MARRGISDWPFGFDPNEFQFAPPGNFGSGSANSVGRSSDPTLTIGFPPVPIIGPEWPQAQSDQTQQSDPIPIGTSSAAGLTIRLVYDAAALAAPAAQAAHRYRTRHQ